MEIGRRYVSADQVRTELHAGGLFFGLVYVQEIHVQSEGKIILTRKIVDGYRPMDGKQELSDINNFERTTVYTTNARGYIIFEVDGVHRTGTFTNDQKELFLIYCWSTKTKESWSEVYRKYA